VCIIANGLLVCFSWGPFWNVQMLGSWSSTGSNVTGQAPTQLEITTQLVRKLGQWIGYYLWSLYNSLKYVRPSGSVFDQWRKAYKQLLTFSKYVVATYLYFKIVAISMYCVSWLFSNPVTNTELNKLPKNDIKHFWY